MKWSFSLIFLLTWAASYAHAQYAIEVVSYDPGSTPTGAAYTDPATALGSPTRNTVEFPPLPNEVTIFNPAFGTDEIVSIGEGGHIALKLSNYLLADVDGPGLGVFSNVGLIYGDFENEIIGDPAIPFSESSAEVAVSDDGVTWISLGVVNFNLPTQGYSDAAGTLPSNFQQPFTGVLSDFNGLPYNDPTSFDVFDLLGGSGGGTWLDVSAAGLARIGYVRFSVADDLDPATALNFELDAVVISAAALGTRVPEPGTAVLVGLALMGAIWRR